MRAEELRIGNRLLNGVVVELTHNDIVVFDGYTNWRQSSGVVMQPIPITEKLLLKCGFTKGDNQTMNDHFFFIETERIMVSVNPENGVLFIEQSEHQVKLTQKITCIHQLQNLYFALTGQELTYTP